MEARVDRTATRRRIRYRIRKKLRGSSDRPRLSIFRSDKHIYVQAIDDDQGRTLAHASSLDADLRASLKSGGTLDAAKVVGSAIAERLKRDGIQSVVFDRGGFRFHGRVKALADAARAAGLSF